MIAYEFKTESGSYISNPNDAVAQMFEYFGKESFRCYLGKKVGSGFIKPEIVISYEYTGDDIFSDMVTVRNQLFFYEIEQLMKKGSRFNYVLFVVAGSNVHCWFFSSARGMLESAFELNNRYKIPAASIEVLETRGLF